MTEALLEPLLKNLNEANWKDIIASCPNGKRNFLVFDALNLLRNQKISGNQCVTSIFLHALMESYPNTPITVYSIFNSNGSINPAAQNAIETTIGSYLTPSQTALFFEQMQKQQLSEQSFFAIKLAFDPSRENKSIIDYISSLGVNVFCRFEEQLMVPSFSMMQELLRAKKGDPSFALKPFLAPNRPVDNLRDKNSFIFILPFEDFILPKTIAGYTSNTSWEYIYHFFFCALTAVSIPDNYFNVFKDFSELVLKIRDTNKHDKDTYLYLDGYYNHIISMNHVDFLDPKQDFTISFLKSIDLFSQHVLNSIYLTVKKELAVTIINFLANHLVSEKFFETHHISIPILKEMAVRYEVDIEDGARIFAVFSAFEKWRDDPSWSSFFKEALDFLPTIHANKNEIDKIPPHLISTFMAKLPSFNSLLNFVSSHSKAENEEVLKLKDQQEKAIDNIKRFVLTVQVALRLNRPPA